MDCNQGCKKEQQAEQALLSAPFWRLSLFSGLRCIAVGGGLLTCANYKLSFGSSESSNN